MTVVIKPFLLRYSNVKEDGKRQEVCIARRWHALRCWEKSFRVQTWHNARQVSFTNFLKIFIYGSWSSMALSLVWKATKMISLHV